MPHNTVFSFRFGMCRKSLFNANYSIALNAGNIANYFIVSTFFFAILALSGDSEATLWCSCQAAACLIHMVEVFNTVPFKAKNQAGNLRILIYIRFWFYLNTVGIELESTNLIPDALSTQL